MRTDALGYPLPAMDGVALVATWFAGSLAVSLGCTGIVRALLVRLSLLDHANERSSHTGSVPRGGGTVFAALSLGAWAWLANAVGLDGIRSAELWAMIAAGSGIAAVGIIDDARGLPARVRLAVHLAAGAAVAWSFWPLPAIQVGGFELNWPWMLAAVAALAVAWSVNLTNFMDGIDGIAASHAAIMLGFLGAAFLRAGDTLLASLAAVTSGGALGFLAWNMSHRGRIFMGDGGSGFLGFAIGALSVAAWASGALSPWQCVAASATFLADATVTLVRRAMRGERLAQAHRSHGYQHLAQRWGSHRRVTALYVAADLLWCVPLALLAGRWASWAPAVTALAVGVPAAIAWHLDAGQDDAARTR